MLYSLTETRRIVPDKRVRRSFLGSDACRLLHSHFTPFILLFFQQKCLYKYILYKNVKCNYNYNDTTIILDVQTLITYCDTYKIIYILYMIKYVRWRRMKEQVLGATCLLHLTFCSDPSVYQNYASKE